MNYQYHYQNPSDITIFNWIRESKTIAVVGLSNRQETASYQVAQVMQEAGYKIYPINPKLAGQEILGEKVLAELGEIEGPVDIVCVFRRSEFLADVAREFLQIDAKIFWAQLGLESLEAAQILADGACQKIVMNKCLKVEYYNSLQSDI